MKFCTECGTKATTDDQKFCKVCGHKFPEMPYEAESPAPTVKTEKNDVILPLSFSASHGESTERLGVEKNAADIGNQTERVAPISENPGASVYGYDCTEVAGNDDRTVCESDFSQQMGTHRMPTMQDNSNASAETVVDADDFFAQSEEMAGEQSNEPVDAGTYTTASYDDNIQPEIPESAAQPEKRRKKGKKSKKESQIEKRSKKRSPVLIVLIIILLLVLLGAGGFFGWRAYQKSQNATIAGTAYSIADTTEITLGALTEEDWSELARLTQLSSVTITGSGEGSIVSEVQLERLASLPNLTELSLNRVQIEDSLTGLSGADGLTTLHITHAGLTSEQCADMPTFDDLIELDLSNNEITDISFLADNTGLVSLDISGNAITDYTALSSLTDLEILSVEQCQVEVVSALPSLKDLTVNDESISDVSTYLSDQKTAIDLYNSIITWVNSQDLDTLKVVLQQYVESADLGETAVSYVNGYLLGAGTAWDNIRASLPADAKILELDENGIYYGQISDGKRSGEGTQYFAGNYSYYTGSWQNDLPNGSGTYCKTTADGKALTFSGAFANGYENGEMTFTVDGQSAVYTAENGTRPTVKQISDTQYAFAQFGDTYWYDIAPSGHGVCIDGIQYQEEQSVEINAAQETSSSSSKSRKKTITPATTPTTPTPTPEQPSSSTQSGGGANIGEWITRGVEVYKGLKDLYEALN